MTDQLAEGTVLDGRFSCRTLYFDDGLAQIYWGLDEQTGLACAVKAVPWDSEGHERFLGEVLALAELHHPNLVPTLGAGQVPGFSWFAMPWYERGTLAHHIEAKGATEPVAAIRWGLDVLTGLDAVHRAGMVHRDIKPANLLVDDAGRLCIADFGLVKAPPGTRSYTTRTGVELGTLGYRAPELARDARSADARSDLYSVAVVLWELIQRGDARRFSFLHVDSSLLAGVPTPLHQVLLRASALKPRDRYATARDMAFALCSAADAIAVVTGSSRPGKSWWRRFAEESPSARWVDRLRVLALRVQIP